MLNSANVMATIMINAKANILRTLHTPYSVCYKKFFFYFTTKRPFVKIDLENGVKVSKLSNKAISC